MDIEIFGTPGNDLGAFLYGHQIRVHGNAQDGVGNTMDAGEIVVEGRAGDVLGFSMRGGKIFVRDSVGYRTALHMKEYEDKRPVLVIGGTSQDFLGEYMAGGIVILLGLGGRPIRVTSSARDARWRDLPARNGGKDPGGQPGGYLSSG
jgi:glutamate synthase domain-containing protein 3